MPNIINFQKLKIVWGCYLMTLCKLILLFEMDMFYPSDFLNCCFQFFSEKFLFAAPVVKVETHNWSKCYDCWKLMFKWNITLSSSYNISEEEQKEHKNQKMEMSILKHLGLTWLLNMLTHGRFGYLSNTCTVLSSLLLWYGIAVW